MPAHSNSCQEIVQICVCVNAIEVYRFYYFDFANESSAAHDVVCILDVLGNGKIFSSHVIVIYTYVCMCVMHNCSNSNLQKVNVR